MTDWLQQLRQLGPPQRRRQIQVGDGYWGITSQGDDPLWEPMLAVIEEADIPTYLPATTWSGDPYLLVKRAEIQPLRDALAALERAVMEQA